jgi:hypothetical protein
MIAMSALAQSVARWTAHAWVRRAAGIVILGFGLFSTATVAAQTGIADLAGLGMHDHCSPRH